MTPSMRAEGSELLFDIAAWQITRSDGTMEWRRGNDLHRIGQPARVYTNSSEEWWVDGKLHRDGGPAVNYVCGHAMWYENDRLHCLHGPALVHGCGYLHRSGRCVTTHSMNQHILDQQGFYVNGRRFTEDEFLRYVDHATGELFIPPGKKLEHDP